jgi:hypothetical protein
MMDRIHKFRVGQIVDLIPSSFRPAATGRYEIVRLQPVDGEVPRYRIKSGSELHERVVAEIDIVLSAHA